MLWNVKYKTVIYTFQNPEVGWCRLGLHLTMNHHQLPRPDRINFSPLTSNIIKLG